MSTLYKNIDGVRVPLTDAEIAQRQKDEQEAIDNLPNQKKEGLRAIRKSLLEEADHNINMLIDTGGDASAWRTYRQSLRDITKGDLDNPTWPTKP